MAALAFSGMISGYLEQGERRETVLAVRTADGRRERRAGKREAVGLAAIVRVDHPATDLRPARFHGKPGQAVPVEDVRSNVSAGELFGMQAIAAGIRLPCDPMQRVAELERFQADEVL